MSNDKLVTQDKPTNPLKTGMAARVAAAKQAGDLSSNLFDYTKYANRIVLCIDDSGSMCASMNGITTNTDDARDIGNKDSRMDVCRKACEEFLNVCNPRDTALGMYTISTGKAFKLSTNYVHLLGEICELRDSGDTPTIPTLDKIQQEENVTRVVIVSDGESGALWEDFDGKGSKLAPHAMKTLDKYKEKKIIIDTVFIGELGSNGEREMKLIAEYTGGLFLVFKSGESFKTNFKYLTPAYRGMLTSGQVKL